MKQILVAGAGLILVLTIVAFGIHPVTEPLPVVRVALYNGDAARMQSVTRINQIISRKNDISLTCIDKSDIISGELNDFDVLLIVSEYPQRLYDALGSDTLNAINRFIINGGGYLGIDAGSVLMVESGNSVSERGTCCVNARYYTLHCSNQARRIECSPVVSSGSVAKNFEIVTGGGILFEPGQDPYLPSYFSLAKYCDLKVDLSPGDAIIASRYGRGRILLYGTSPELTNGLDCLVGQGIRWCADKSDPQTAALGTASSWEGVFGLTALQSN